ncbi:MAG: BT4734/BF3469 family protein, partial [Bacteroidales bacterium]
MKVSYFNDVKSKKAKDIDISEVFNIIKLEQLFEQIKNVRNAISKEEKDAFKRQLPSITVSGTFKESHSSSDLIEHSGLIQIDIDKVVDSEELQKRINQDKLTFASFISPSGTGLKIIVKIPPDKNKHLECFHYLEKYYLRNYNVNIDKSCKDVSRLMFLSADKNIYINDNSDVLSTPIKPETQSKLIADVEKIISQIEKQKIDITGSYDNWLRIGFAISNGLGEGGRNYYHRVSKYSEKYDELKCNKQFDECFKQRKQGITIKSFFQIAKEFGIDIKPANKEINQPQKIKVKKEISKFEKVENYLSSIYDIRYNEVSNEVEYKPKDEKNYKQINENNIYRALNHNNIKFSLSNLIALLKSDFVTKYNPIVDYFESIPYWNKETEPDYIDILAGYVKAKDEKRFRLHFKKMLVRSVACALIDGGFNKQAFILVGEIQNSGKSTFCRWLCPPTLKDYYAENISTDKDSLISLSENFIINL